MTPLSHAWRGVLTTMFAADQISGNIGSFDADVKVYLPLFREALVSEYMRPLRKELVSKIQKIMSKHRNLTSTGFSPAFMTAFAEQNKAVFDVSLGSMSRRFAVDYPGVWDQEEWEAVLSMIVAAVLLAIPDRETLLALGEAVLAPAVIIDPEGLFVYLDHDSAPYVGTREEYIEHLSTVMAKSYANNKYNDEVLKCMLGMPPTADSKDHLLLPLPVTAMVPQIRNPRHQYQILARLCNYWGITLPLLVSDVDFTVLVNSVLSDEVTKTIHMMGTSEKSVIERLQSNIPDLKHCVFQAIWAKTSDVDLINTLQNCLTTSTLCKRYSDALALYQEQRFYLAQVRGLTDDLVAIIEAYW